MQNADVYVSHKGVEFDKRRKKQVFFSKYATAYYCRPHGSSWVKRHGKTAGSWASSRRPRCNGTTVADDRRTAIAIFAKNNYQ